MPLDSTPLFEKSPNGTPGTYRCYINGKWRASSNGATFAVTNPATGEVIAHVPKMTREDAAEAVEAAYQSRRRIRDIPAIERVEILDRARVLLEESRQLFVETIVAESGKPVSVAEGEVKATIERLRLTLEEVRSMRGDYIPGDWVKDTSGKFAIVRREPRGVVAAICPFNYPLFISSAKVIPALVSGNTVIAKPSSETPLSLLLFARLLEQAGIPPGTLNVVTGSGREVGDVIVESPLVDMITFTGSTSVGEQVVLKAGMKKLHLELGGKGAALVLDDANLELAAKEVAKGGLRFAGQRCDAIDRILVHESVAEEFIEKLVKEVQANYKTGDPRDRKTAVGPLITPKAAKFVMELIEDARQKGAKVLTGGTSHDQFVEPTVLDNITPDMRVAWEESFGPVLPIIRVRSVEEMLEIANKSEYALDSAVFTADINKAFGIARRLADGEVTINGHPAHGVGHFPFGGNKKSGMGREGIGASIEEMTRVQTIVFNLPPKETPFAWA
ncbi:MAG TPA: aldehyde dehydrogenase family protein [Candidatus Thermoplasmatota archaeon]|nr:aldehyde dehydrogenase family protein [Candidatus Thermoplasmatota archaeon]